MSDSSHGLRTAPPAPIAAFLLLLLGAFLRCPALFLHGRVWAEESTIFLGSNWHSSVFQILVAPHLGYFSLWNNFWAAIAVRVLPLQFASFLFTGSAILLLLATAYFVYQAEWLQSPRIKALAVVALLFTTGDIESWLNLVNSAFPIGLLSAVILLSNSNRLRWQRCLALALAVLSGPLTVLLTPFFLLRAWRQRHRGAIAQAAIVGVGSLIQVGVAFTTRTGNRTLHFDPAILGPILLNKQIIFPLFGRPAAVLASHAILKNVPSSMLACWFLLAASLTALAFLFRNQITTLRLLALGIWLGAFQTLLALGGGLLNAQPGFGERYAYVPNTLLLLGLLAAADRPAASRQPRLITALLCCALASGVVDYLWLPLRVKSNFDAPPWYSQGLRWHQDETIRLQANPDNWEPLRLTHRH